MLKVSKIYIDYSEFGCVDNDAPVFSWSVHSYKQNAHQKSFSIKVWKTDLSYGEITIEEPLWQQDNVLQSAQSTRYAGPAFEPGARYAVSVQVTDAENETSPWSEPVAFLAGKLSWKAEWIASPKDKVRVPAEFFTNFENAENYKDAVLFVCGIGYHSVRLNGQKVSGGALAPSHSNYAKVCYYEVLSLGEHLAKGENTLVITVADGWRRMDSQFIFDHIRREIEFFGIPQLTAALKLVRHDGEVEWIYTNPQWQCRLTPYLEANLYDGTIYDERLLYSDREVTPAITVPSPGGQMRADAIEPIVEKERYYPVALFSPAPGVVIADFGQNIAGVCEIRLPQRMEAGQEITIKHAELLDENGLLYMAPLREVKARDTFISAGRTYSKTDTFKPEFTYHGFRYVQIEGYEDIKAEDIWAIALYNDIKNSAFFECGSPMLNRIYKNAIQTETANIHSMFTDCPQRNERMAWLNDSTVRFEALPYNFNIGRMFPKVVRDIINEQQDGMIAYTSPYIFSARPADPVCSSFLIAGAEALMFTGNKDIVEEAYNGFAAWEDYLLSISKDYILEYTMNGDWAGPQYACADIMRCTSRVIPGALMSTGYSYYNCVTLSKLAQILKKEAEADKYARHADKIQAAFLEKWFDAGTGKVGTGSDGSQAFALWLGILPQECRQQAADVMHNELVKNNYKFTTGNLTWRYMLEMLSQYGYADDAYHILQLDEYPSIGYMIQNEATTVWERFELKKDPWMNSHNHPMFGAAYRWFFASLCGVTISSPGCETVNIRPYFPGKLLSAQCRVETIRGPITVKWVRRYGALHVYIGIPFGTVANVSLPKADKRNSFAMEYNDPIQLGSGCYYFSIKEE